MIQNINRLGFEQAAECRILLPPFLSSLPLFLQGILTRAAGLAHLSRDGNTAPPPIQAQAKEWRWHNGGDHDAA